MSNQLTLEQINMVIRMDLADIMGFDMWSLNLDIEKYKRDPNFRILDNPLYKEIRDIVQENIAELITKYFTYQPQNFENPVDQYAWIIESEAEIRNLLGRGLDVPYDSEVSESGELIKEGEPLKCYQNTMLQNVFDKLFDYLLRVGETHKFDPEIIDSRVRQNDNEVEEED